MPTSSIKSGSFRPNPILCALLSTGILGSLASPAVAQESQAEALPEVNVIDFRGEQLDGIKYTRDLQDTPRIITVLPNDLLEEQNVTSIRDALRNIPGISLQAGEGNPPGGDQLKIRGFNARDDLNVNGTRDLGNYFRDPFYIDQLEVVKGPNSAFSGRGSAGGTINFVTKKPGLKEFNRFEGSLGTDNYYRATLDMNRPIDENSAFRVNLMTHQSDIPGRDIAEEERYGLYAAYTWGFAGPTQFTVDYLHTTQNDIPDAGLPFDRARSTTPGRGTGLIPAVNFDNFYGHVDDYRDVQVDQLGLTFQHALANGAVVRNQTRYSIVSNDSITSSPRILGNDPFGPNTQARGDLKPRDQTDKGFSNQTDLLFSVNTGSIRHDIVVGAEVGLFEFENARRPDVNGPVTNLFNPTARNRPAAPYDGTVYGFETEEFALYALNTMALSEQWELNAGVRWDRVTAKAFERGRENLPTPGQNLSLERTDTEVSTSLGLVYKLNPSTSLYAAVGNAFEISGNFDRNQIQLAGGAGARVTTPETFNLPPEKTTAYELGAKWALGNSLDLNAAVFRTEKKDARFPNQDGNFNSQQGNRLRIQGFELLAAGKLTEAWRLYSGFAYLDSEVLESRDAFAVGQELGGTPETSFNVFTTYDFTPKWTLGGGLQYVADQTSGVQREGNAGNVIGRVPSYTVADVYVTYKFTPKTQVRVNLYNAFDERYISQIAEGAGQGIPGKGRQLIATLRHDF